jgi:small-conductance mechanosensitive channel
VGDYIRLDGGYEGSVVDIGWRATKIRALSNNVILIPNSKLAQSIVTNFHLPEKRMSISILVSVGFEEDIDKIEEILKEEAATAVRGGISGLCSEPEPVVRFNPGAAEYSLQFTVSVQIEEFTDQFFVQHELRKRFFKRFKAEGVTMPYPIRTIMLRQTE